MTRTATETRIANFDTVNLRLLREEMNKALAAVGEKFGIAITTGRGTYADKTASFKVELATKSASGEVVSKAASDFATYAPMFGLDATDLGKQIVIRGEEFTICGLKPGAPKFPVLAKKPNGTTFKFQVAGVLKALGRPAPETDRVRGW